MRNQVHRIVGADGGSDDFVFKMADLLDAAVLAQDVMCIFAAIAISDRGDHVIGILSAVERDLGNLGEILAHHIAILGRIVAQLVEIHLLEKMLALRALFRARITGIPKAAAVGAPGHAAATRRVLNAWNDLIDSLAAGNVENVERTVFAAVVRHRDRHQLALRRWHEPVDRGRALRIDDIRIQHHLRLRRVRAIIEQRNHRLLLGRLIVIRKYLVAHCLQAVIRAGAC